MSGGGISSAEATAIVKRALRYRRRDPELEAAAWNGMRLAITRWDGARPFEPWARSVIRGNLANQYRAWRKTRTTTGGLDDAALDATTLDAERDPVLRRTVLRALQDLPPRQAEAMMHFANGLTEAETGAEMGVCRATAHSWIRRATLRLQRSLRTVYKEMNR